jgi:hypothetical protein
MKLTWGWRIAMLYCSFVAMMLFLVFKSMNQKFDLVTPDYYAKELQYQDLIDASRNQAALSKPVGIHATAKEVILQFPAEQAGQVLKGNVHFYSAVNAAWDREFPIDGQNSTLSFSREGLQPTAYTLCISWEAAGKKFYQESVLNLNAQ